jgi:hypothetical protein
MDSLNFLRKIHSKSFSDQRGILESIEVPDDLGFEMKRIYYISQVPSKSLRGAHAHKKLSQIFLALSGSYTLRITDGNYTDTVDVVANSYGYFLPSGFWRELYDFKPNTICLILASEHFDQSDYIMDFNEYLNWRKNTGN